MHIIAFCGRKGSGKSLAAQYLRESLTEKGRDSHVLNFADPIKKMLLALGLPSSAVYSQEGKTLPRFALGGKTGRYAMQTLATEWGRDLMHHDIWTRVMDHKLETYQKQNYQGVILVDDVRFENEIKLLRLWNATLIHIHRPDPRKLLLRERLLAKIQSLKTHRSERLDFSKMGIEMLVNDGTPEQLRSKIATRFYLSTHTDQPDKRAKPGDL
jgi:dephospho-CoA kinase